MKKSIENNNEKSFLKEGFKGDVSNHHKKYLGTDIPEGYFTKSKLSILEKIKEEQKLNKPVEIKKQLVFWLKPQFKYIAAASLVFILSLTVWLQNTDRKNEIKETNIEFFAFEDDILINSLFVEDAEIDLFTETTLINEIVIKAELSEQKMDDLFINSLFIEDSLIDNYTNDGFLETIIL